MITAKKRAIFFKMFSANLISRVYVYMYMYMYTVYLHMLPPCQEGSSAAKSVCTCKRVAGRGWVGLALGTDY